MKVPAQPANEVIESCDSTNRLAKQLAESGCQNGTWISSRKQTAGRGRHGRKWESLEGNISLSVVLYVERKEWMTWVPIAAAVATSAAVESLFPSVKLEIKWPNDLWLDGKKIGGILCEGGAGIRSAGGRPYVVVGLGFNVFRKPSTELGEFSDLSVFAHSGNSKKIDEPLILDKIRTAVVENLILVVGGLWKSGPSEIKRSYDSRSIFSSGALVEWGAPQKTGKVEGLGPLGELCVRTQDGNLLYLLAEDVKMVRRASYGSLL